MAFIAIDQWWFSDARLVAAALRMPEAEIGYGLMRLASIIVSLDRDVFSDMFLGGAFGHERSTEIRRALVEFRIIEDAPGGWRPVSRPRKVGDVPARIREPERPVVYFIQAPSGLVKIGFTKRLQRRISTLQTASSGRLKLLASAPGSMADEAALHLKFADQRRTGEWFEESPALLALIASVQRDGRLP